MSAYNCGQFNMISRHFIADPDLLRLFTAIQPDAPWGRAIALMQALQDKGFDKPKSEDEDSSTDPTGAAEFTQSWSHDHNEGAIAYFARSRQGTVATATLTWAVGVNLSGTQAVQTVKQTLVELSQTLGPVHAQLDQVAAWVTDGQAGSGDEVAASACWSRAALAAHSPTPSIHEYQTALRALKAPIRFSAVLEKHLSTQWNVFGALSA